MPSLLLATLILSRLVTAAPSPIGVDSDALFARADDTLVFRRQASDACTVRASGSDDVPALSAAFASCNEVVVPEEENLLIASKWNATGLKDFKFRLYGNLTLNDDVQYWAKPENVFNVSYQVNSGAIFFGGENVLMDGGGTIDGNGQTFYDARISDDTLRPPHLFVVYEADGLRLNDIHFRQSPRWTTFIHSSKNVHFSHLSMISRSNTTAKGRESNRETDGIDIYRSDQVLIHDIHVDNGDDCVSFKPNATNVFVSNIYCKGSHGVSIGSLGEYGGVQDIVENIVVNNVTIVDSENGPRIKTWGGEGTGYGRVNQVVFSNFFHSNNDSPMTIDNCYKTSTANCEMHPSNVTIDNVYFTDQHPVPGGYAASGKFGNIVAAFSCSIGRCHNVYVNSANLTTIPSCGLPLYANVNLNVLGTDAYRFESGANFYGAGGVLQGNSTPAGVTCEQLGLTPIA